ncbi:MAG: PRC-barrel domain-containing protein [Steroidobacteraceae bacterium]
MLHTTNDLIDCTISATDGRIGRIKDCYIDDETWVVRYLVVETGTWLSSRKVLIPPSTAVTPNWVEQLLSVQLTRQQVEDSPNIDTDRPVSRQHERTLLKHYDYPCYWNGSEPLNANVDLHDDQHLRSSEAIASYRIHATDGQLGHVACLLFDENWKIRYIIANTSDWWLGHQVLIASQWITDVSWDDRTVAVRLTRDAVKHSPPYHARTQLDRDEEIRLHDHYRLPGYWASEVKLENPEFRLVAAPSATTTHDGNMR